MHVRRPAANALTRRACGKDDVRTRPAHDERQVVAVALAPSDTSALHDFSAESLVRRLAETQMAAVVARSACTPRSMEADASEW